MFPTFSLLLLLIMCGCKGFQVNSKRVLSEYKGNQYLYVKPENQDPLNECEIPPLEEEDLTHFRRKRMIMNKKPECIEKYPHVLVVRSKNISVCLGTLVNYQYGLTVFGCVRSSITKINEFRSDDDCGSIRFSKENFNDLSVRAGSAYRDFGGRLLSVSEIISSPRQPEEPENYDAVLLKLNVYTTPTPGMISILLPWENRENPALEVSGYGSDKQTGVTNEGDSLQRKIKGTSVTNTNWANCYEKLKDENRHLQAKDFICVVKTDVPFRLCQDDRGAPVIHYDSHGTYGVTHPLIQGIANDLIMQDCAKDEDPKNAGPATFTSVRSDKMRKWMACVFKYDPENEEKEYFRNKDDLIECAQYPNYNLNLKTLRRKKRLTTQTGLVCLEDHPYTVSIRLHGRHWCGGAIIDDWWILTSAQCFDDTTKKDVTVRMGSVFRDYGGKILSVTALEKHPKYKKGDDYPAYNLAMLQINMPIFPSVRIQIVKLIPPSSVRLVQWGGGNFVTGYGAVKSPILEEGVNQELRMITVKKIPYSDCQKAYEGITKIKKDQMCMQSLVEGVTLCTGDLGDPLVQFNSYEKNGILFGLAIFPGKGGCNDSRPSIFTKIRPSRQWIDDVIRGGLPEETEAPPTSKPVLKNAKEETSKVFLRNTEESEVLEKSKITKLNLMDDTACKTQSELDLRHVNLLVDRRRRRKRMAVTGKQALACQEDYPYTVAILKNAEEVICSGVIIAKQWVLTAAVCLEKCSRPVCHNLISYHQLSIRMGSVFGKTGGRLVSVIDIRIHPDYKPLDKKAWIENLRRPRGNDYPLNDLAMLKFNVPYRPSPRMQRVQLPERQSVDIPVYEQNFTQRGRFVVSGFGNKWSSQPEAGYDDIRAIEVMYEDVTKVEKTCADLVRNVGHDMWINKYIEYERWPLPSLFYANYRHLCMFSKENITFCVGDNGMPMVWFDGHNSEPILLGIHVTYYNKKNCLPMHPKIFPRYRNRKGYENTPVPGIFVRVSVYVDWIKRMLKEDQDSMQLAYVSNLPVGAPFQYEDTTKSEPKADTEPPVIV